MNDFLIFVAPFIILVISIALVFWGALEDDSVS
ncbi:cytochrome bd oxidase small subunit CydS [Oceanobacillus senegalensis]